MSNPDLRFGALAKPLKGTATLKRREKRAELVSHEQKEMRAAKKRDKGLCRWPSCAYAKKQMPIEGAHFMAHRGMGGNADGTRTRRDLIVSLCKIHHSLFDRGELGIEPMTDANADGPLAFYVRAENGRLVHYATERLIGVSEPRS